MSVFFLPGTPSIIPAGTCGLQQLCCQLSRHRFRFSVLTKLLSVKCQSTLLTQSQPEQEVKQKHRDSCEPGSWEAVQQQLFRAASRAHHNKEHYRILEPDSPCSFFATDSSAFRQYFSALQESTNYRQALLWACPRCKGAMQCEWHTRKAQASLHSPRHLDGLE